MCKPNALYLKTQRLIAEKHRDTEGHTRTHTKTNTQRYTKRQTQTHTDTDIHRHRHTQRDTFVTHMNLNKLMLRKYSNLVLT